MNKGRVVMAVQLRVSLLARFVAVAMVIGMSTANAAEVKVMAVNAVKEAHVELISVFEKSSGHKVTTIWGRHGEHYQTHK